MTKCPGRSDIFHARHSRGGHEARRRVLIGRQQASIAAPLAVRPPGLCTRRPLQGTVPRERDSSASPTPLTCLANKLARMSHLSKLANPHPVVLTRRPAACKRPGPGYASCWVLKKERRSCRQNKSRAVEEAGSTLIFYTGRTEITPLNMSGRTEGKWC